ncbi:hypothetical protein GCM10022232_63650 [Streptomyces plumbiresistens]|uniref:Secreted protein n=1 Tax=Streptomyces plumbiresistens TaxID=511811 RepID=A0ABP7SKL9_9ACTN
MAPLALLLGAGRNGFICALLAGALRSDRMDTGIVGPSAEWGPGSRDGRRGFASCNTQRTAQIQ